MVYTNKAAYLKTTTSQRRPPSDSKSFFRKKNISACSTIPD